jgi:hypothetical protein
MCAAIAVAAASASPVRIASATLRCASSDSSGVWQVLSALVLLAMGGIHLYYVAVLGAGGLIGVLFVLNAIGGLVLAIAMLATRRRLLRLASVLSLLFMAGTLLALVLALTVGLLGIREQWVASWSRRRWSWSRLARSCS